MKRVVLSWVALLFVYAGLGGCDSASSTGVYFKIDDIGSVGASYMALILYEGDAPEGPWKEVTLQSPVRPVPLAEDGYRFLVTLDDSKAGKWYRLEVIGLDGNGFATGYAVSDPIEAKQDTISGIPMPMGPIDGSYVRYPTGCVWFSDGSVLSVPWDRDCDGFILEDARHWDTLPEMMRILPPDCNDGDPQKNPGRVETIPPEQGADAGDQDCSGVPEIWCWDFDSMNACHPGTWDSVRGVCDISDTLATSGNFCQAWDNQRSIQEIPAFVECIVPKGTDYSLVPRHLNLSDMGSVSDIQILGPQGVSVSVGSLEENRYNGSVDEPIVFSPGDSDWGMATLVVYGSEGGMMYLDAFKLLVLKGPDGTEPSCSVMEMAGLMEVTPVND